MEKLDRIQQLHQLFATHSYPIKLRALAERLECSEKNARRLIDALQDFGSAGLVDLDGFHKCEYRE